MPRVPGNLSDAIRRILAGPVFDRQPRPASNPVLCDACGSVIPNVGDEDHEMVTVAVQDCRQVNVVCLKERL
jgi:hypothetical protein